MQSESIVNFYEQLVFDNIERTLVNTGKVAAQDMVYDIACLALNRLPARYIRYHVDAVFYISDEEMEKMLVDVDAAVQNGHEIVLTNPRRN